MSSSSHFIIVYIFCIIFMLMSNWYMINTFVSNLGTATVIVFVICKSTYCIEFTNFFKFVFLSLTSRFLYLLFLNNVVLVAYVIAVTPIVWVSSRYLDIYRNYEITSFLFRNKLILILIPIKSNILSFEMGKKMTVYL